MVCKHAWFCKIDCYFLNNRRSSDNSKHMLCEVKNKLLIIQISTMLQDLHTMYYTKTMIMIEGAEHRLWNLWLSQKLENFPQVSTFAIFRYLFVKISHTLSILHRCFQTVYLFPTWSKFEHNFANNISLVPGRIIIHLIIR